MNFLSSVIFESSIKNIVVLDFLPWLENFFISHKLKIVLFPLLFKIKAFLI